METPIKSLAEKLSWYDKWHKFMLVIPLIIMLISLVYIGYFFSKNGDIMHKDVSLSGGTTITLKGDVDTNIIESSLKSRFPDISIRKLTEIGTG